MLIKNMGIYVINILPKSRKRITRVGDVEVQIIFWRETWHKSKEFVSRSGLGNLGSFMADDF